LLSRADSGHRALAGVKVLLGDTIQPGEKGIAGGSLCEQRGREAHRARSIKQCA
jgi:hypothetical protein